MSNWAIYMSSEDLQHHGVLGMHWGIRRYQNKDGSLTARGKRRLGIGNNNGVSGDKYKATNTNKSGTSKRDPFGDNANLKTVNRMLKDTDNCSLCTFAFDLRNRGIDVRAGGSNLTNDGKTHGEIESWYKENRSFTQNSAFNNMFDNNGRVRNSNDFNRMSQMDQQFKNQILAQGEGTSGHLTMQFILDEQLRQSIGYPMNIVGSHDVFYKVENGDVYIYDAQSGEKIPYDQYIGSTDISGNPQVIPHATAFLRTDDLTPNVDVEQISNNGKLIGFKQEKTKVAEKTNSATTNYSPTTGKELNTKPLYYNPPYQSKSEMELFKEDLNKAIKKTKSSLYKTKSNVKKGLNAFKNVLTDVANVLVWSMFT